ncbi:hypothetical protein ONZ45_g14219 [Pleurotus djamor]|nr:hypothetical protein ONZ45_g14219 [Pleurotus djamor]
MLLFYGKEAVANRSDLVASRIQSLGLRLDILKLEPAPMSMGSITKFMKKSARRLSGRPVIAPVTLPITIALRSVVHLAIQNMTDVCHCELLALPPDDEALPFFFEDIWPILKRRLRSMTVNSATICAHNLSRFTHDMTAIEKLDFDPVQEWHPSDSEPLARALNYIAPSLTSLRLTFGGKDYDSLYDRLTYFPKLRHFDTSLPFTPAACKAVSNFLERSASGLKELDLLLSYSDNHDCPESLSFLTLQDLHTLRLHIPYYSQAHISNTWAGPCPFTSLESLVVKTSIFSPCNFVSPVCEAFARWGKGRSLRVLHLDVYSLNGDVFDELARTFPLLQGLSIRCCVLWDFSHVHPLIKVPTAYLEPHFYHVWGIKDLSISRLSSVDMKTKPSYIAMSIFAQYMPSIRSFRGRGNLFVPDPIQRLFEEMRDRQPSLDESAL